MNPHTDTTPTSQDAHRGRRPGKNTDNRRLSRNPRRDVVENDEYAAFTRRVVRAYSRRVAAGDIEALASMVTLAADVEHAIQTPSSAYAPSDTPGQRSPPGSASAARPPANAGTPPPSPGRDRA